MFLNKIAGAVVALAAACAPVFVLAQATPGQIVWTFDRLDNIGGIKTTVEGNPKVVDTPLGKAIEFDGVDDAVFIDKHPLAGASEFTFEAIYRPDGGAFEQRWFHLAERDPKTGLLASADHPKTGQDANPRFLFELRVVDGNKWYLDAFVNGPGYNRALIFKDKLHPVGDWYHVAQTYDGKTYRSYVNGVLQGEAEIAFRPQGEGAASLGTRINRRNYFKGAIRQARFTPRALMPDQFLKHTPRMASAQPIVQPGAPGEPTRVISAKQAADLSQLRHTVADVRFMQGMISHHAQALEMTALLPSRTTRENMRLLALRINVSQADEITMMRGWLLERGESVPDPHAHHAPGATLMPGMLTTDEMARLARANDTEFDRLFLEFMIKHHEGALTMVETLFSNAGAGQEVDMFSFASHVDADQRVEIARMTGMLKEMPK